jgi:hypothetical protein
MSLEELLKKNQGGVTFRSDDIYVGVTPTCISVVQQKMVLLQMPYRGEAQVRCILDDYGMRTSNFSDTK